MKIRKKVEAHKKSVKKLLGWGSLCHLRLHIFLSSKFILKKEVKKQEGEEAGGGRVLVCSEISVHHVV